MIISRKWYDKNIMTESKSYTVDRKESIMEIILSVLFIVAIVGWFKLQDGRASNHLNTHVGKIDYGKMNEDRIMNDLSNSQVNQNIINGKYDKK